MHREVHFVSINVGNLDLATTVYQKTSIIDFYSFYQVTCEDGRSFEHSSVRLC
jgi:hypothetical protein